MEKQNYELNSRGVNALISDFVEKNWKTLSFSRMGSTKIIGIENVQVNIQSEFKRDGKYLFLGTARVFVEVNEGDSFSDIKGISGYAVISNGDGGLCLEGFDGPITLKNR